MHEDLQRRQGIAGRLLAPEPVDEPLGGDHLGRGQRQHCEDGALPRRSERDDPTPLDHLDGTEQPELHALRVVVASDRMDDFAPDGPAPVACSRYWCRVAGPPRKADIVSTLPKLLLALMFGCATLVSVSSPAATVGPHCGALPGLTPNVWQGLGIGPGATDEWETAGNWSFGVAPSASADPYVCIPTGGVPRIRAGEEAQLVVLDVATGATLEVDTGGKLFLYGDQATRPSTIRGRLEVSGSTLGGPARTDVLGRLVLRNLAGAATLTTRECAYLLGPYRSGEEPCVPGTPIAGDTGLLVVADQGVVDVEGGGVNFGDQFQMIVHGLLRVRDGGYLAADHGTRLELRPRTGAGAGTGTLRFEDDGDYLEGKNDFGIPSLGAVVNQGQIVKNGGTGTTLVTGTYSQPAPGGVTVSSGTLLLPSGATKAAKVGAGDGYGSGRCELPVPGCQAKTFVDDRQNVRFKVPTIDTSGAAVVVRELSAKDSPADIGYPVEAHAVGLKASAAKPAVLTLSYDERLLGDKSWQSVRILRKADGSSRFATVRACQGNGRPPAGQVACVDRRGLAGSSRDVVDTEGPDGSPDVVMVVRTTQTSRWVAR